MTKIELSDEDAILFMEFQKRYVFIGQLVGYMDSLNVFDLKNMTITMDIDQHSTVSHMSITKHYRK